MFLNTNTLLSNREIWNAKYPVERKCLLVNKVMKLMTTKSSKKLKESRISGKKINQTKRCLISLTIDVHQSTTYKLLSKSVMLKSA